MRAPCPLRHPPHGRLPANRVETGKQHGRGAKSTVRSGRTILAMAVLAMPAGPALADDDGFTISLKGTVQFDAVALADGALPAGARIADGGTFRRIRIGVAGRLSENWSYEFTPKSEAATSLRYIPINNAFVQYDGLAPLHFKAGALSPPTNFDGDTSSADLLFLERAQPTDLARSLGGGTGRSAVTMFYYDATWFAGLSYAGGIMSDAVLRQQALVSRAAWRPWHDEDSGLAIGADVTHVFALPPSGATHDFRLRQRPEMNEQSVDLRLIDTGNLDTGSVTEFGMETAGNSGSLYAQGGLFHFFIDRATPALSNPSFSSWYLQASWVLTGEARVWRASKGVYAAPEPAHPLDGDGFGAFEIAARYSEMSLDDRAGAASTAIAADGIRGGRQQIGTLGLNWYPTRIVRFMLDYQHVNVARLNAVGGKLNASMNLVSLRSQIAF